MNWLDSLKQFASDKALGISAWGILTGTLGKLDTIDATNLLGIMLSSLADITLLLSFIVTFFTVFIKAKEFINCWFPKKDKKKEDKS